MTDNAHPSDPWKLDVPYAVLHAGLRAIAADAAARDDHHTAAHAHSVLAGEPIPPLTDPEPGLEPDGEPSDSPSYLMLELALRHVLQQMGPGGTGTIGDLTDYIERVLANDLTHPRRVCPLGKASCDPAANGCDGECER